MMTSYIICHALTEVSFHVLFLITLIEYFDTKGYNQKTVYVH